jgi:1-phosphatidylinositol-4-phosphate 5-kinase
LKSISLDDNVDKIFQSGEGTGQSGSFFFFTKDGKYVVKTLRYNEKDTLLSLLDDLFNHFIKTKNQSLIGRVYGVYTIQTDFFEDVNIFIM